jgi:hypothetical protein
MESHKYPAPQPEHSGLQVIESDNAPEVVYSSPDTSLPEAYVSRNATKESTPALNFYGQQHPQTPPPPGYDGRAHYGNAAILEESKGGSEQPAKKEKRICGLSKKVFIIVVSEITICVIVAAVVGGVYGASHS